MKRWLLCGLLVFCTLALAQPADPGGDVPAQDEAEPASAAESPAADGDAGAAAGAPRSEPDEEFTPSEEISEDYPVPLPSDI